MKKLNLLAIIAASTLAFSTLSAKKVEDMKPIGSEKLVKVVKHLESLGVTNITKVELDDGRWEVDGFYKDKKVDLTVDPMSLKIIDGMDEITPHHN